MTVYTSDWVLPIAGDPVPHGSVAVENGRIAAVGSVPASGAVDLGAAVILPALVNAHTHLELSHLRNLVPPSARFLDWIAGILAVRGRYPDPHTPVVLAAARNAIEEARRSGTGLVGDISNTLVTVPLLRDAGMPGRVFYELIGFNADDPASRVRRARSQAPRPPALTSALHWHLMRPTPCRPGSSPPFARISTRTPETSPQCIWPSLAKRSN
jgi:cytosine/adenosine deaminase-related metal-dependent hydrolase